MRPQLHQQRLISTCMALQLAALYKQTYHNHSSMWTKSTEEDSSITVIQQGRERKMSRILFALVLAIHCVTWTSGLSDNPTTSADISER